MSKTRWFDWHGRWPIRDLFGKHTCQSNIWCRGVLELCSDCGIWNELCCRLLIGCNLSLSLFPRSVLRGWGTCLWISLKASLGRRRWGSWWWAWTPPAKPPSCTNSSWARSSPPSLPSVKRLAEVSSFGGRVFTTPGDLSECNYFYSHRSNKLQLNKESFIYGKLKWPRKINHDSVMYFKVIRSITAEHYYHNSSNTFARSGFCLSCLSVFVSFKGVSRCRMWDCVCEEKDVTVLVQTHVSCVRFRRSYFHHTEEGFFFFWERFLTVTICCVCPS